HRDLASFPTRRSSDLSAPAGASAQARIREDAPQAIQGILERLSRAVFINKQDVQNRLVEFCLTALGWRLDATNTQVWVPISQQIDRKSTRLNSSHDQI